MNWWRYPSSQTKGNRISHKLFKKLIIQRYILTISLLIVTVFYSIFIIKSTEFQVSPLISKYGQRKQTIYFIPGAELNCSWQLNYVCRFWFYLRCIVFGKFKNLVVVKGNQSSARLIGQTVQKDDIIIFTWRSPIHRLEPPVLSELNRELKRKAYYKSVRIGVFHFANEVNRRNWPWYKNLDFVLRNYWIDEHLPSNVQYIPLGPQFPQICKPSMPEYNEQFKGIFTDTTNKKPKCTCGSLKVKRASERAYLWSFFGSLRNNRSSLVDAVQKSKALKNRGFLLVARKFGGDGVYGSKNALENPKTKYLQIIGESSFVFAPCGNVMETHRIYEAIILGALPVIENCQPEVAGFFPFPSLIVSGGVQGMIDFVARYSKMPKEMDLIQQELHLWWTNYVESIARNVSSVIFSLPETEGSVLSQLKRTMVYQLQHINSTYYGT